ncbi:mitochondrial 54S ribosomal protein YmL41 [Starmerella bacillaris]|uniref:Large ribosomal subunit protein uL23m n=1 Tax=Starmerella bacillaris TaxID=1247836 RepID=A0AAV5RKY3_STABA|nr:mitochondrial 54S ribosomal protein YmL41 [Starmerella bacillaris]
MPRQSVRKILQGLVPPKAVSMTTKEVKQPPTKRIYDAENCDPQNYSKYSQKLLQTFKTAISSGEPHFKVGGKEVYFPWAPITLLKPSARMTPYQAQFQVPRTFNKLDLRDYLWHLYGLRAINITTQIKWSKWARSSGTRFRTPQKKKMIIDMEQPFVWPVEDKAALRSHNVDYLNASSEYPTEMRERFGSDLKKPAKAFEGIMGPYPEPPQQFISKKLKQQMTNSVKKAKALQEHQKKLELIKQYVSF